jgi:hypothetical protein
MNASLPDFLRRAKSPLRATLLVAAITLVVGVAWAQTRIDPNGVNVSGSVIGDDVLYSIGGGRAVSMGPVPATCRASASASAGTAT